MDISAFLSIVFVMASLLGGGVGIPLGIPPEEDPLLVRLAPEECLYFTTWAGMAEADPNSPNEAERLLAEQEIRESVAELDKRLQESLQQIAADQGDATTTWMAKWMPVLIKTLLTRPAAVYVTEFDIRPTGTVINGALIVNLEEFQDDVETALEGLHDQVMPVRPETVEISGATFHRLQPIPEAPVFTWGIRGRYLILGLGDNAVEDLLQQARTPAPQWLVQLQEDWPLERPSTLTYADIQATFRSLTPLQDPDMQAMIQALGLDKLKSYTSVTGLDEERFVSRTLIAIDGQPEGLLSLLGGEPLKPGDLAHVPEDAMLAMAFRMDADKLMAGILEVVGQVEPRGVEEFNEGLNQVQQQMGFRVKEDLLESLGDVWNLYAAKNDGGLITGWTLTVSLRDRAALVKVQQSIINFFRQLAGGDRSGPKFRMIDVGEHTMVSFVVPDSDFWVVPSWCLTEEHLVFSLFPQPVKSFLRRKADASSVTDVAELAVAFDQGDGPVTVVYQDTREILQTLYPWLLVGGQIMTEEFYDGDLELDITLLPSLSAFSKHLRPAVTVVRRTDEGLLIESRRSLPGSSLGAMAPIMTAALLPAISAAREAASRAESVNNLRQIGLSLHNYHDTFGGFPAAYNTDEDGKPLLSWRVHMLPFVEEPQLYDQFHFDEPWSSEHNRKLIRMIPPVFTAPGSLADPGKTNLLGIRGKSGVMIPPKDKDHGLKHPTGVRFQDITDGSSNTIVVVEASDELAVIWTKPDDYEPDPQNPAKGLVGIRPGIFQALFCDASVRAIAENIDLKTLRLLFSKDDGQPVGGF